MLQVFRWAALLLAAAWLVRALPAAAGPGGDGEWPLTCAGFSFTCSQEPQALPLSRKEYQQGLDHLDEAAHGLVKALGNPSSARLDALDLNGLNVRATPFVFCGLVRLPVLGGDSQPPATFFTIFLGDSEPKVTLAPCSKYYKEHWTIRPRPSQASPKDEFQKALDAAITAPGAVGR